MKTQNLTEKKALEQALYIWEKREKGLSLPNKVLQALKTYHNEDPLCEYYRKSNNHTGYTVCTGCPIQPECTLISGCWEYRDCPEMVSKKEIISACQEAQALIEFKIQQIM